MELLVKPEMKTEKSTISKLLIDGKFFCFVLEDIDRGLRQDMPLEEIKKKKVHGKTAIPAGRYQVIINPSNRFKRDLPLLLKVPGFEGIRIHPGNTAENTEGCLLPGLTAGTDRVGQSKAAFNKLFPVLENAVKTESVFITIDR